MYQSGPREQRKKWVANIKKLRRVHEGKIKKMYAEEGRRTSEQS